MSPRRPRGVTDEQHLIGRASWQLGLQIGALFLVCLLVVAGVLVFTVLRSQRAQTLQLLDNAVAISHGGSRGHDPDDARPLGGVQVAVVDPHGSWVSAEMPAGLPDTTVMTAVGQSGVADQRTVELDGRRFAVRTVQRGDDTVQAVLDLDTQQAELTRLLRAVAVAGGVGLLLAILGSAWLSRRAVRPMAQALALQRRFVADAGHELRTPLTLISTRAQLMARRVRQASEAPGVAAPALVARVEADAAGLVEDTANLTSVLEDLLAAADTRSGSAGPADVAELAREAVAAAQAYASERGLRLRLDTPEHAVLETANRSGLYRAVTALLDNALGHASGEVDVTVSVESGRVLLQIADDGPGLPDDLVPTMFRRFASNRAGQADNRSRHYGLGLALVAEIVNSHRGTITAGNRAGGGALFTVVLPR